MNRLVLLAASFAVFGASGASVGCRNSDRSSPSAAATVALVHAAPADLAREVADAERLGTWREVQHRWQGQTVRWTVTRQRLLCRAADDCFVAAFPIQRPAKQGWMPQLQFAPGQFAVLTGLCGSREQCDVTIEGTVSQIDVSPEMPTSVQLSNVRVVSPPPSPRTQTASR
jgi:hypothetical protein